jgi:plasmid stabilization system protein ParE
MLDYQLSDRATRDLENVRAWYDRRSVDLGNRLVDDVLLAIRAARERPASFPEFKRGVRTVQCRSFPYKLYFATTSKYIDVLAIYHTARDPNLWDDDERS